MEEPHTTWSGLSWVKKAGFVWLGEGGGELAGWGSWGASGANWERAQVPESPSHATSLSFSFTRRWLCWAKERRGTS